jgi:hypothetical protein
MARDVLIFSELLDWEYGQTVSWTRLRRENSHGLEAGTDLAEILCDENDHGPEDMIVAQAVAKSCWVGKGGGGSRTTGEKTAQFHAFPRVAKVEQRYEVVQAWQYKLVVTLVHSVAPL